MFFINHVWVYKPRLHTFIPGIKVYIIPGIFQRPWREIFGCYIVRQALRKNQIMNTLREVKN